MGEQPAGGLAGRLRPANRYRLVSAAYFDADLSRAYVLRVERKRSECRRHCRLHRHIATWDEKALVPFGLLYPTSAQICVQLVVQSDGRERYPGPLAGCHHLRFELDAMATASTPARRGLFFYSVHVSTYFGHDAPKTVNATQDGMTGRLRWGAASTE